MATKMSKHAFGNKEAIENAKTQKKIDEYDILFLDNGEIGWLDGENNAVINTPRTQKSCTLNGTSFGSLNSGDTIPAETSLDELITMLTQKSIPAKYNKPLVTLVNNNGTAANILETGTTITPKLNATFTQNDAGDLTEISIRKGSEVLKTAATSSVNYDGKSFVLGDETVHFSALATYKEGVVKNDNLDTPSPSGHIVAGTISSEKYSFTGQRYLFYGTGIGSKFIPTSDNIRSLANKKLNAKEGYTFNISVVTGQQYVVIAYPSTTRDIEKIFYVEGSDPYLANNFVKSTVQVADARGVEGKIPYKCYVLQLSTPIKSPMTLNVTI